MHCPLGPVLVHTQVNRGISSFSSMLNQSSHSLPIPKGQTKTTNVGSDACTFSPKYLVFKHCILKTLPISLPSLIHSCSPSVNSGILSFTRYKTSTKLPLTPYTQRSNKDPQWRFWSKYFIGYQVLNQCLLKTLPTGLHSLIHSCSRSVNSRISSFTHYKTSTNLPLPPHTQRSNKDHQWRFWSKYFIAYKVLNHCILKTLPIGSPSRTRSCSRSVNRGISSFTSSITMKIVASEANCWAPLFWKTRKEQEL